MPRQARLDAPGALHHVMGRGIEGISIFRSDEDREDFLTRLGALCEGEILSVHAWALLDNHFHLLIRTGKQRISKDDDVLGEPDGETEGDDGVGFVGQVIFIYPYVPFNFILIANFAKLSLRKTKTDKKDNFPVVSKIMYFHCFL